MTRTLKQATIRTLDQIPKPRKRLLAAPSPTDLDTVSGHRAKPFLVKHLEQTGVMSMSAEELLAVPAVGEFLANLAAKPRQSDRSGSLRGSSIDRCMRAQAFQYLGTPTYQHGDFDSRQALIYSDGQFRHIRWQCMFLAAQDYITPTGVLRSFQPEYKVKEVARVPLPTQNLGGVDLEGHVDGVLGFVRPDMDLNHPGITYGLEIKGSREISWIMDRPAKEHVRQIATYGVLTGITNWVVLYESKSTQETREHVIDLNDHKEVTDGVRERITKVAGAIQEESLPDIQSACEGGGTTEFYDCAWHHVCLGCQDWGQAVALTPKPA